MASDQHARVEPDAGTWRFGRVHLDERLAQLTVDDRPVTLDRSSYDILLALLRNAGDVVGKEELLEAGWPGRVVTENSLAKAISRLRQALAEDGSCIRAVHGYGYRLAVAVGYTPLASDASPEPSGEAMRIAVGDRVPQRPGWRIERRLGRGGASIVFLACHASDDPRAIKFAVGESGLKGLKREIALSRYIRSVRGKLDTVAPLLGWNLSHAPYFLELPYYEGGNLREWANARGGLPDVPPDLRLTLALQLCEAVAALHEIGIIHRDLKPENIYPVSDAAAPGGFRVVLGDLGVGDASASAQLAELGITSTLLDSECAGDGAPRGSLRYISPEVLAGEAPTQRSDLFAVGVLLFQLVVGDLRRVPAPGWEADVADPLLREDIAWAAAANPQLRVSDATTLATRLRSLALRRENAEAEQRLAHARARREADYARMVRRRRLVIAVVVVMSAFLAVSIRQQVVTDRARKQAQVEAARANSVAERAQAVAAFLTEDLLQLADPFSRESTPQTLRDAIDRASGRVDERFAQRPDEAAAVHAVLARAYQGLNHFDPAVAHFETQLDALRRMRPIDPGRVAEASVDLCQARHWQGGMAEVWSACRRARADFVAAGKAPLLPEVFLSLADSREGHYARALSRLDAIAGAIGRSGDPELMGHAYAYRALYTLQLGRIREHAVATADLLAVRRSEGIDSMDLGWAYLWDGNARLLLGHHEAGRSHLERAKALFEQAGGKDHPHALYPAIHLSHSALLQGDAAQARDLAVPAFESLLEDTGWQNWTISAALNAIMAQAMLGDRAATQSLMQRFEAMASHGLDDDFPYLRERHWLGFARAHLALGNAHEAREFIERLKGLAEGPDASSLLDPSIKCLESQRMALAGDVVSARRLAQDCRAGLARLVPERSPLVAWSDRVLAGVPSP